jgi:hypothetical protein
VFKTVVTVSAARIVACCGNGLLPASVEIRAKTGSFAVISTPSKSDFDQAIMALALKFDGQIGHCVML